MASKCPEPECGLDFDGHSRTFKQRHLVGHGLEDDGSAATPEDTEEST